MKARRLKWYHTFCDTCGRKRRLHYRRLSVWKCRRCRDRLRHRAGWIRTLEKQLGVSLADMMTAIDGARLVVYGDRMQRALIAAGDLLNRLAQGRYVVHRNPWKAAFTDRKARRRHG